MDVWAAWEPYTALAEIAGDKVLINGRGLWAGNSFLAATDKALNDPGKRQALQDYLNRLSRTQVWANQHVDAYSAILAKIIGFSQEAAKLSFARRKLAWQAIDSASIEQQQATADFYHAHQLIAAPLNVQRTFASGFGIPALSTAQSARPIAQHPGLAGQFVVLDNNRRRPGCWRLHLRCHNHRQATCWRRSASMCG